MGMRKWFFLFVFVTAVSAQAQSLHEYGWTFYNTENKSVQHNFITDIEFDTKGRAWVATSNFGLNYYDNNGWHVVKPMGGL
jgi:ligand-binding sensor domain-containing protein